jgi:hypothetical protein
VFVAFGIERGGKWSIWLFDDLTISIGREAAEPRAQRGRKKWKDKVFKKKAMNEGRKVI